MSMNEEHFTLDSVWLKDEVHRALRNYFRVLGLPWRVLKFIVHDLTRD